MTETAPGAGEAPGGPAAEYRGHAEPADRERAAREVMAYMTQQVARNKRALRYEFVEAIPRTLAGKIIRRELVDRERMAAHARHR